MMSSFDRHPQCEKRRWDTSPTNSQGPASLGVEELDSLQRGQGWRGRERPTPPAITGAEHHAAALVDVRKHPPPYDPTVEGVNETDRLQPAGHR